jgi:hypothetical protein
MWVHVRSLGDRPTNHLTGSAWISHLPTPKTYRKSLSKIVRTRPISGSSSFTAPAASHRLVPGLCRRYRGSFQYRWRRFLRGVVPYNGLDSKCSSNLYMYVPRWSRVAFSLARRKSLSWLAFESRYHCWGLMGLVRGGSMIWLPISGVLGCVGRPGCVFLAGGRVSHSEGCLPYYLACFRRHMRWARKIARKHTGVPP